MKGQKYWEYHMNTPWSNVTHNSALRFPVRRQKVPTETLHFFWRFINGSAVLQNMYTQVDVKIKFFYPTCCNYHTFVGVPVEFTNPYVIYYKPISEHHLLVLRFFFLSRIVKKNLFPNQLFPKDQVLSY